MSGRLTRTDIRSSGHIRARAADRGGQTPAIALTGYVGPEDRARLLASGFQVLPAKAGGAVRRRRGGRVAGGPRPPLRCPAARCWVKTTPYACPAGASHGCEGEERGGGHRGTRGRGGGRTQTFWGLSPKSSILDM